jgi:hypothetical protein
MFSAIQNPLLMQRVFFWGYAGFPLLREKKPAVERSHAPLRHYR